MRHMHCGYISSGSSGRRRATGDGLGLGLSIVAATVQVHHGVPVVMLARGFPLGQGIFVQRSSKVALAPLDK